MPDWAEIKPLGIYSFMNCRGRVSVVEPCKTYLGAVKMKKAVFSILVMASLLGGCATISDAGALACSVPGVSWVCDQVQ
ncbi:MAG TPA: hypothetical protein EYM68_03800 [Gammaproteobacteria bacterium]|jgi:hypothetical protein|nr:hypothetical protein [Gammaproteobacteria bacterium]